MRFMALLVMLMSFSAVACSKEKEDAAPAPQPQLAEPPAAPDFSFLPDELATIDGKKITREDVVNMIMERAKMDPMFAYTGMPRLTNAKIIKEGILMPLIDKKIMLKLAEKSGFKPDTATCGKFYDEQISTAPKDVLDNIKAQLAAQNKTLEQYRQEFVSNPEMQEGIALQMWVDKDIKPFVTVTDSDILKIYNDTKDSSITASHILITPNVPGEDNVRGQIMEKATPEQKAEAKAKLQKVLEQIRGGADFGKMAEENSACPSGKSAKGSLGTFGRGQMVAAFEKEAFALQPGGISDVFESPFGYHIVRRATFDEAKKDLKEQAQGEKLNDAIKAKIEEAKKVMKVEVKI